VFVRLKVTPGSTPWAEAITLYAPTVPLAMKEAEVATPFASVVAVVLVVPVSINLPLAPVAGAAKLTTTPAVSNPFVVTVTTRGVANAPLIVWLWGDPLVAVTSSPGSETLGAFVEQFTAPSKNIARRIVDPSF
jgi:hypothetical protein